LLVPNSLVVEVVFWPSQDVERLSLLAGLPERFNGLEISGCHKAELYPSLSPDSEIESWGIHPPIPDIVPSIVKNLVPGKSGFNIEAGAQKLNDVPGKIFHNKKSEGSLPRVSLFGLFLQCRP
jgi:hypothetical protein